MKWKWQMLVCFLLLSFDIRWKIKTRRYSDGKEYFLLFISGATIQTFFFLPLFVGLCWCVNKKIQKKYDKNDFFPLLLLLLPQHTKKSFFFLLFARENKKKRKKTSTPIQSLIQMAQRKKKPEEKKSCSGWEKGDGEKWVEVEKKIM